LRDHARLFGWDVHAEPRRDTYLHGENFVAVDYRRDGGVLNASRYTFYAITNPVLAERARRNKRLIVLSWLAEYGS
jgi:hypothetical protein